MKRSQPEHDAQAALFREVLARVGQFPALALLYAIPNGGERNVIVAARMKAEGVRKGMLDMCLPVSRMVSHGGTFHTAHALYIEMKAGQNYATPDQRAWATALMQHDNAVAFCWSAEEAFCTLLDYIAGRFEQKPEPWKKPR